MLSKIFGSRAAKRTANLALQVRGFAAARVSDTLGLWRYDQGFNNRDLQTQIATMVSRSRDMYKNSPHHKRFCNLVATNVVGDGFSFKSLPHDGFPGMPNYRVDKMASRFIEWHYWRWASDKNLCDSTARKNINQIDLLCVINWAREGEFFILVDPTAPNVYGIDLRVIRRDAVDINHNDTLKNGNVIRMGVELDSDSMRPVAYYLKTTKEYATHYGHGPLKRIPASINGSYGIIHGYTQEEEDQTRGVPLGHAGLCTLKMLDMWNEAELAAAIDENTTVRTYHAPPGREGEIANLADAEYADMVNQMTMPKEPGQSEVLPNGWGVNVNTPSHPNRETTAFKNSFLRDYATAVNCEYSNLCNDWAGVNYGSVRAGMLSERDMWRVMQQQYITMVKTPVYHAWLKRFLQLEISGAFPAAKFEKFAEHEFRGRRWAWVDPLKDIKGAEVARKHGWKTDQQITAEFDGDFEDNMEEIRRSDEMVKGTSLEVKNEKATAEKAD